MHLTHSLKEASRSGVDRDRGAQLVGGGTDLVHQGSLRLVYGKDVRGLGSACPNRPADTCPSSCERQAGDSIAVQEDAVPSFL